MLVNAPPSQHPHTPVKLLLLSGLSDPRSCALSPEQERFLRALPLPEAWKIYRNFPCVPGQPWSNPRLWRASLANLRQFLGASRSHYLQAAVPHWQALARSTDELIVLALSCGLEIVRHCLAHTPATCRVRILALGPVAWQRPEVPHTLIQGRRDYISRLFFRSADVVLPGVGHMDYLANAGTLHALSALLCSSTSPS